MAPTGLWVTSVPFRNAIKRSCLQEVVYTYVSFIVPRSHCRNIKMAENCDESEKELGDWCENGSEDREPNAATTP